MHWELKLPQDDCDLNVAWTFALVSETPGCGYSSVEEWIFTVTDDCGNTNTATATFAVVDITPPTLNIPADITLECDAAANPTQVADALALATATDDCSVNANVTLTSMLFSTTPDCGVTGRDTYIFAATDECGNVTTGLFNITTEDTTIPLTTNCPDALIVECGNPDNALIIGAWLDAGVNGMGSDACSNVTVSHDFDGNLPPGCTTNTPVRFTVTDECGNVNTCIRLIGVRDTAPPTIVSCPGNMTINSDVSLCGSNIIYSTPSFTDVCDSDLTITQVQGLASGSTFPIGDTVIEFMAEDDCGLVTSCTFTITVVDSQLPSIECPSNDIVVCADTGGCDWTSDDSINPITAENCPGLTVSYTVTGATGAVGMDSAMGVVFNIGRSTVCYEVSDGAGNTAECCFDVVVEDCEEPAITCPVDFTVECDGAGNAAVVSFWLNGATAIDNCGSAVVTNELFNTASQCGGGETFTYRFIATDPAGNETYCYANITIEDTTDPIIDVAASPFVSTCATATTDLSDWLSTNGGAVSSDLCGTVTWSNDFAAGAIVGCSGIGEVTVNFIATDECGNTAQTSAMFTVDDTEAPVIVCPSNITIECGDGANDALIEIWTLTATASDNCSTPTVTNTFPTVFTPGCGDSGIYNVTFTATDDCGNTSTCEAMVTIEDTTNPSFLLKPQDLYVECDGAGNLAEINAWIAINGGATANDNCDPNPLWNINETGDNPDCGGANVIEYEFRVEDECGNSVVDFAFVYIEDTTEPVLTIPADLDVACSSDIAAGKAAWLASATAVDLCGGATTITTQLTNTISGCGSAEDETYIFIATDECGNETTGIATFTISDVVPPVLMCPTDLNISCGVDANPTLIAAWLNSATGTDDCGDVTFTNNYTGLLPPNCGGSITVTFTGEDGCGNTATCTANIIMDDTSVPDFLNFPSDMTINVDVDMCGSNPIFSTPSAMDACGATVTQTAGPASGTAFPLGDTTIEFTAIDQCGNSASDSFVITVVDSDVPLILCPSTPVAECTDIGSCVWTSANIGPSLGLENCPGYTITYTITGATTSTGTDDASGTIFNLGASEVCYTITDSSAATSQCCFTVQIQDCGTPELTCPVDQSVECDGAGNVAELAAWLASVSAVDNCDPSITITNSLFSENTTCGGTLTQVYEFVGIDTEGNNVICYGSFIIEDTTAPTISTPASPLTVECTGTESDDLTGWLNNSAGAAATDVCSGLTWSHDFTGALSDLCGQTGTVDVTFTATDDCGNTATTMAAFTIEDTTPPAISCPNGIVLLCDDPSNDAVIANWLGAATGSDDCGTTTITNDYNVTFVPSCGNAGTYTIIFTATDECGNTNTCNSTIEILDNELPSFDILPIDEIVECSATSAATYSAWLLNNGGAVASDNCGIVTWSVVAQPAIPICGNSESISHVFTITDECGNAATASAVFSTEDTTDPILVLPSDLMVECDGAGNTADKAAWLATASANDECGTAVTSYRLSNTISGCGGATTEVYTFVATDECGLETTGDASFTIEDLTMPTIVCPADLVLECGAPENDQLIVAWLNTAVGTDICGSVRISKYYNG